MAFSGSMFGLLIVLHLSRFTTVALIRVSVTSRFLRTASEVAVSPCFNPLIMSQIELIDGPSLHHPSQFAHQRPSMPLRYL
uniref:Secreted protein n=1 Tax=Panagrellus redivivus TaxID=6233 RepID=A0A7E4W7P5_PANRE